MAARPQARGDRPGHAANHITHDRNAAGGAAACLCADAARAGDHPRSVRGQLMSSSIFVAIDTPDLARAIALANTVKGHVGGLKLGLEFFAAHGHHGVRELGAIGLPIFLDLKLHDIPNTVASAIQALHGLAPSILTIHAAGGRAMMEDAKAAAPPSTKVVAVTVLTSLDAGDLASIGVGDGEHAQVERLTALAH